MQSAAEHKEAEARRSFSLSVAPFSTVRGVLLRSWRSSLSRRRPRKGAHASPRPPGVVVDVVVVVVAAAAALGGRGVPSVFHFLFLLSRSVQPRSSRFRPSRLALLSVPPAALYLSLPPQRPLGKKGVAVAAAASAASAASAAAAGRVEVRRRPRKKERGKKAARDGDGIPLERRKGGERPRNCGGRLGGDRETPRWRWRSWRWRRSEQNEAGREWRRVLAGGFGGFRRPSAARGVGGENVSREETDKYRYFSFGRPPGERG